MKNKDTPIMKKVQGFRGLLPGADKGTKSRKILHYITTTAVSSHPVYLAWGVSSSTDRLLACAFCSVGWSSLWSEAIGGSYDLYSATQRRSRELLQGAFALLPSPSCGTCHKLIWVWCFPVKSQEFLLPAVTTRQVSTSLLWRVLSVFTLGSLFNLGVGFFDLGSLALVPLPSSCPPGENSDSMPTWPRASQMCAQLIGRADVLICSQCSVNMQIVRLWEYSTIFRDVETCVFKKKLYVPLSLR